MLYKLTEKMLRNGRTILVVESSDTAQPGFIDLPPHLLENALYKSIAQIMTERDQWVAEQQRLAMERSDTPSTEIEPNAEADIKVIN